MEFYFDGEWYKVSVKAADTIPAGAIIEFPSLTAPYGYLLCDGRAVSRTEYADLFAAIGTTHGAGDGSTTFNLPTRKGRNAMGYDPDDSDFDTIGETGGSKYLQEHDHYTTTDTSAKALSTSVSQAEAFSASGNANYRRNANLSTNKTSKTGTGDSGNLQPYQVSAFYIKYTKSIGVLANTKNETTTSEEDAYSCDYINKTFSELTQGNLTTNDWTINYRKKGNVVMINIYNTNTITVDGYATITLGTMPSGLRPLIETTMAGMIYENTKTRIYVEIGGAIKLFNWDAQKSYTSGSINVSVTYLV